MEETMGTKELANKVLREIGCTPQEMEDGRIWFDYQGITFLMEAADDDKFVNLIWPWCYSVSKFDIDDFARLRQAVNEMNARGTATVMYAVTDSDEVAAHIKKSFLLVPEVPELDNYLKVIINGFFLSARSLDLEVERLRLQGSETSR